VVAEGVDSLLRVGGRAILAAMKKLLFLGACLVALASQPAIAQAGGPEVAVVRITEYVTTIHVSVTRAEGKSEQWKFDSGDTGKRLDASGQGYQKLLVDLYQQGFHLQSTFSSTTSPGVNRVTMVLTKGQPSRN
jgi:hypothetical protein